MRAWARRHRRALIDALRRWGRRPLGQLGAAGVIALALMLPLIGGAAIEAASRAAGAVDHDITVTVFLEPGATEEAVRQAGLALRGHAEAAAVDFKPRAQAFEELKARPAWRDLLGELDGNPLPDAYSVRLRSRDPETVRRLRSEWSTLPSADRVTADSEWAEALARLARFAQRILGAAALVLALAVLAVIAQLTRMQVVTRRAEVELSQLLGASASDVRRPFLWDGLLQGLVAGGLACLGANALIGWLGGEVQALTSIYGIDLKIKLISALEASWVAGLTGLLGLAGSGLAVSTELRRFARAG